MLMMNEKEKKPKTEGMSLLLYLSSLTLLRLKLLRMIKIVIDHGQTIYLTAKTS